MRDLRDAVVVVSGAGSGIGLASARAYGAAGARLHLLDIRGERVEAAVEELRRAGVTAEAHALDCGDAEAMAEVAARVLEGSGRVDLVQNGAGMLVAGPVEQIPLEQWEQVVQVNLWSVIHGVRAFLPALLKNPPQRGHRGWIVNIASFAGLLAFPFTVPYSTTKFAVVGLSEALSLELHSRGVGVTAVCPGAVKTRLMADGAVALPGERARRVIARGFDQFSASPEAIAGAILHGVRRGDPLLVPSPWLGGLWRLRRLGQGGVHRLSQAFYDAVQRLQS